MLPKRVSKDLTIGVRLIVGRKSKKVVVINEIRRRSAYLSSATKVSSGDDSATGSKTGRPYARDKTRDESSGKATDVEESFTSLG